MAATFTQSTPSQAPFAAGDGSVLATISLASYSLFICDDMDDCSVDFYLDGPIECTDMQNMAQAMPLLMKAPCHLTSEEEVMIS